MNPHRVPALSLNSKNGDRVIFLLAVVIALTPSAFTENATTRNTDVCPVTQPKPALDFKVIEGVEVKSPERTVRYLRVEPPAVPPTQTVQPAVAPAALTAEQAAAEGV
jgi:hypothetical protein